jgi:dihydroorotate dehydrogenase
MRLAHWLLLRLPPETAHEVAKFFLKLFQWLHFRLLRRTYRAPASIVVVPVKPRFPARWGVAAGLDKDAEFFASLGLLGAGFVEVGTVTPLAQGGNPKPRLWRPAPGTLVNHMGFNSVGVSRFRDNLLQYRASVPGLPVFANIGKNRATEVDNALGDYAKCFDALAGTVDGFVVNLSSPNTPGLTGLQNDAFLAGIARLVPQGVPVLVKLSPDLPNKLLEELSVFVKSESRLAGIVLTNTSREMAEEVFDSPVGGLSGRPLFSRALECVSLARQAVGPGKIIVGVGGVYDLDSARQMRRAGADLVELYTALVYQGAPLMRALGALD